MLLRKTILTFVWAAAMVTAASAQQGADMDPVVVTASLAPEKASYTGRNLLVIRGDRFAALPVHSIDELLRYIPGVEMQMRGPFGAQSDLVIRGGTFQQVLVILDGVRLNDPNTGHFSSYIPIAPAEIERIEILKGASSSVYGSDAVGGVVHVITKSFAAGLGEKRKKIDAQIGVGEYNLLTASAGAFINDGNTAFGGGIQSNNTRGQLQRGTRGFVYAHTASLSLLHHIAPRFSVALRTAYDDRDFSAQNFYTTFVSDTSAERVKTWWNQLQLRYKTASHNVNLSAAFKNLNDHFRFNSRATPNQSTSRLTQLMLSDDWKVQQNTTIVSGLQVVDKAISSNDRGNHHVKQIAGFAVLNQKVSSNLNISPSLRLDWNEAAGWELVPQASASYRTRHIHFRASAGKTIRDADFTERYNNYNKTFVSSGRIGNPWLVAERSFSYEGGVDVFANENFKVSATYFERRHKDLIDYVPTSYSEMPRRENLSPNGNYALAKNIATVNTSGVEADVQFSKTFRNGHSMWLTTGMVWLNSESSNATPSFYVSSHARYLTNFNFWYNTGRLSVAVNGVYKNRNPQTSSAAIASVSRSYFVANLKLNVFIVPQKFSAYLEVDNFTNATYADLLGSKMPGRWLLGGFRLNL